MKKYLIFAFICLLFFAINVFARTDVGVTISGPGYYGSYSTYPNIYSTPQPNFRYNPPVYRQYVEPPRFIEPRYKSSDYYRYRSSCFYYPIHDHYGRVVSYTLRCM